MLRTVTRPSSAFCFTTFTSSLRRCSVGTGKRQPDDRPVVRRGDPEVGALEGLLDGAERALVVGGDHQQAGLGHAEPGHLAQLGLGAVVVDLQVLDQGGRGPSGADGAELGLGVVDRLGHVLGGVGHHECDQVVIH